MSWLDFFKKKPEETKPMPKILPMEKIEKNIARFQRAIDQNTKGGDRLYELNKNLAYWEKMRDLARLDD